MKIRTIPRHEMPQKLGPVNLGFDVSTHPDDGNVFVKLSKGRCILVCNDNRTSPVEKGAIGIYIYQPFEPGTIPAGRTLPPTVGYKVQTAKAITSLGLSAEAADALIVALYEHKKMLLNATKKESK